MRVFPAWRGCQNPVMPMPTVSMSAALTALIERAVARVRQALPAEQPWPGGAFDRQLAQVALASEFAL
ncbi:hypothetical protein, partial [Xanthomonas phaseoli]|uniref:hypothetical protein n=1 Tax=Xanthomonas phaseoli TaxID=1985254 RepID=UPI002148FA09